MLHSRDALHHRLAAVWFADVVGYTRLSRQNEEAALRLVGIFQGVARREVESAGGRVVKLLGDGVLAEFGSTEAAVRAALALQREFQAASWAAELPATLRVGVHVGDVASAPDGDIYGDGVNTASRLQEAAEPGQVVVSEDVWRQLRQRTESYGFTELAKRQLEGASEPTRIFAVAARETGGVARPVPPPPEAHPWWRVRARVAAGIAALALAALLAVYLVPPRGLRFGADPGLDPNRVVVAPFNILSADPRLGYLHEGLADVLVRNLDGAGPLRTASLSRVVRGWQGPADRESAAALARRHGAGLAVYSSVFPAGRDSLRVSAAVLDVAADRLAEVRVSGSALRIDELTDSLTVALLRELGRTRAIGAVRHASFASRTTLPALKAFLTGEQFYRRTAWDSALAHYRRALEEDSTFAPALRHTANVISWRGTVDDSLAIVYALRAGAHNRGLGPRDSLLVLADSLSAAANEALADAAYRGGEYWGHVRRLFATLGQAADRYPDDPEVWYMLGDARYHFGYGPAAATEEEIMAAFEHAIRLDSAFALAYIHPVEIGLKRGGRAAGLRYTRPYLALDPTDVNAEAMRLVDRVARTRAPSPADLAALVEGSSPDVVYSAVEILEDWPDTAETAVHLTRARMRMLRADSVRLPGCGEPVYDPLAQRLAFRGRLRAALCAEDRHRPGRLMAELALLGALPGDSVARLYDDWVRRRLTIAIHLLPRWAELRDTARIRAFRVPADSTLRATDHLGTRQRARYDVQAADAYLALARGDAEGALARFLALPDDLCGTCSPIARLTRARLLAAAGRREEALRVVRAWPGAGVFPSNVLRELERGRLAEGLGRREEAAAAYRYVVDAWMRADPELRPRAEEARAALRRLGRG